jgi:hypothetical protein
MQNLGDIARVCDVDMWDLRETTIDHHMED